ncbi:hypothetical protein KC349_g1267 [Hortaea werneckii]|nr:hypothetical protein KC349_g1267 [Hortaea werneckii]
MPPQRLTELDSITLQDRDQQAQVLRQALDRGVRPFVEVVCENELACSTLHGAELENTLHEAYIATTSVHREILDGLIDGTLVLRCSDPSTAEAKIVAKFKERTDAVSHPGVYQQGIATAGGLSPTTTEHKKAIKDVYNYCFGKWHHDQILAHVIDSIMEPHTSMEENHQAEVARIRGDKGKLADREELREKLRGNPLGSALIGLMEYMETQKHK